MAKRGLSFHKYPALHELQECHGVDFAFAYRTDAFTQTFTHYLIEGQRQKLSI